MKVQLQGKKTVNRAIDSMVTEDILEIMLPSDIHTPNTKAFLWQ